MYNTFTIIHVSLYLDSSGDFYSCDQLLNIRAFSMLRRWILVSRKSAGLSPSPGATPTPDSFYQVSNNNDKILCLIIR